VTLDKGHGRLDRRSVQTSTAGIKELDFPYVGQVFRIERESTDLSTREVRREVVYGLTSLEPKWAGAARIGGLVRGGWEIENQLHWVRDVVYDEDRSQVRTGQGPRLLASLRNFAIGCLRVAGQSKIASSLRHLARSWSRVFALLGL
jgi:hypothetical protein